MENRREKGPNYPRKISTTIVAALLGLGSLTSGCQGNTNRENLGTATPIVEQYNSPIPTPTQQLSTDWHVCATIQEGEGVIAALRRASNSKPHEWSNTVIQKIEIRHTDDGSVEVYSWKELLENNPVVQVGDEVCDTLSPRLSKTATPRPEDIHR